VRNLANELDLVYTFRVSGELYHRIESFEAHVEMIFIFAKFTPWILVCN
jgi:hypothetical protein